MNYKTIIFDLDGTIIDSSEGITKAVAYALDKHGVKHENLNSLRSFIGPPLRETFMDFCGVSEEQGDIYVNTYREYYTTKGIYECCVYEGIPKLLENLKKEHYKILLATSKPQEFAQIILAHFNIAQYFDFIGGAKMDNTRTAKDEVIMYSLKSAGVLDWEKSCVMIGDKEHDVFGAKKHNIDTIAVTYGFGTIEELKACEPLAICENTDEIYNFLSSK